MNDNQTAIDSPAVTVTKLTEQQKQLIKWQNKLLPWLIGAPTALIVLFLYLATVQVNHFNDAIDVKEKSVTESLLPAAEAEAKNLRNNMDYIKWVTLVKMEEAGVSKRYHQGGLLLLSRIFMKYLGFLTGMIIAIVGAVFIIGKLNEDPTKIEGSSGEKIKFSLVSSSPGILFGIMGTSLMIATIIQHNDVSIQEQPMFLNPATIQMTRQQLPVTAPVSNPIRLDQLDSIDNIK